MDSLPFANTAKGDKELEVVHKFVFTLNTICVRFYFSLVAQTVKSLPAIQETWVRSLAQEDSPEKGMATYPNILA